jgi:hypothetical protein
MHDFPVEHTGNYILQEDPLGGTSYVTRSDWSDSTGKFILGRDAAVGIYGERNRKYFSSLESTIYNGTADAVAGYILGRANNTETVRYKKGVHEIRLTSNTHFFMPNGYKIDWQSDGFDNTYTTALTTRQNSDILFAIGGDTNIVVDGGELYGNSDTNFLVGDVYDTPATDSVVTLEGLDVEANELQQWHIYITSGTGSGQSRRINYNLATSGGNTVCHLTGVWQTKPDNTSKYRITPMEEWSSGFEISKSKDITIRNVSIHDFSGDGMAITASENVLVENCDINIPYKWFIEADGTGQAHNLVGRQGITLAGGNETRYNLIRPDTTLMYRSGWDTLRNVKITKCKIRGGYPGGIDLEPLGRCYVENLEISECDISNTPGYGGSGIIIYMADSSIVKNLVIRDNLIRSDGVGIWLAIHGAVKYDSTTFTEDVTTTEYDIDVADGSIFTNGSWVTIGDDEEFCRVATVMGNTIRLYNSAGARIGYNGGPTATTHAAGTKIYLTRGSGSDYGYWDNVKITGNTITPITPGKATTGIYFLGGSPFINMDVSNNIIMGHGSKAFEATCPIYDSRFTNNVFANNQHWCALYNPYGRRVEIKNNLFRDNDYANTDSSGTQLLISNVDQLVIDGNTFACTDDSTIARGMEVIYSDSVIISNNLIYGHKSNYPVTYALTKYIELNNIAGFSASVSSDSLSADMIYDFGNSEPGDTTAAQCRETKRTELRFLGYRDVGSGFVGGKIVSQISATPGYGGDPWKVQNGHLLFYTTNHFQLTPEATSLRAIITGNGLGLADSSYINFFPKNSASFVDPDTLWRYVGELGYGFRDSSGTIQYKNLGGSWANIGSGSGSGGTGDVVGPALGATADAIALYDGTTGKAIKNSLATISSGGELSVPVVYARPSSPLGFLVSREAILAGTDSCANLGITDGAGALTLYAGNSHNSQITVNNSDVMLFKDAAYYAFQGTAANAIYVSGEKVFAASDSFAALQVSGGCGQLYLVSSDGLPEYATITLKNTDYMEFAGAIKYDFDAEINTLAGTNPGTDTAGDIAIDTDDSRIEFHDGTASRVIPALQCRTFTILEPDVARGKTDDIILFHVMADAFPHGITIKDIALSASAAVSDTHVIEEWSNRAGSSQSTIESITMSSTTYQEDDGTLSDAAIAADAFININLDDSTDDVASLEITITFYVNEGD